MHLRVALRVCSTLLIAAVMWELRVSSTMLHDKSGAPRGAHDVSQRSCGDLGA